MIYLLSALRRERGRLQLVAEAIAGDEHAPDSAAAHVLAAQQSLDEAIKELVVQLNRQAREL